MFFTSAVTKKHLGVYSWVEDQWKGFLFTYFFQLEAFSDFPTTKIVNIPKSQRVNFRRTMSLGVSSEILQLTQLLPHWTREVSADTEEPHLGARQAIAAGCRMLTCHTCPAAYRLPYSLGEGLNPMRSLDVMWQVCNLTPSYVRRAWEVDTAADRLPSSVPGQASMVTPLDSEVRWPTCKSLFLLCVCCLTWHKLNSQYFFIRKMADNNSTHLMSLLGRPHGVLTHPVPGTRVWYPQ